MSLASADIEGPVVVTGGAGFLGVAVVEKLLAGGASEVRVVDIVPARAKDARVRHFHADLRSDDLGPAFAGARTVLHLAGCQYHTPLAKSTYALPFFEVNVDGTRRVIEAAEKGGAKRLVFVSTNMVYGLPRELPVTEKHPREPIGPYGQSKLAAERLVEAAAARGLDSAIVRPGLIVGPGRAGLIERIIKWIRSNRPIVLIGNANNHYEVMHVDDVAALVIAAAKHRGFGSYNCAAASVPTMREWIGALRDAAGSRSRIVGVPGAAVKPVLALLEKVHLAPLRRDQFLIADRDYYMSAALAERELGWRPLKSGLEAVLDTYRWHVSTTSGVRTPA
jgi:dTDP-glucose 4,6-dehydratase